MEAFRNVPPTLEYNEADTNNYMVQPVIPHYGKLEQYVTYRLVGVLFQFNNKINI